MVAVSLPISARPDGVLPLSVTASVNVVLAAGVSLLSLQLTLLVALVLSSALVSATHEVPLPQTKAPLVPAVTVSVPSPTDSVAVSEPPPASTSPTDSPLFFSDRLVCSVALYEIGVIVATGASLTAAILMVAVSL